MLHTAEVDGDLEITINTSSITFHSIVFKHIIPSGHFDITQKNLILNTFISNLRNKYLTYLDDNSLELILDREYIPVPDKFIKSKIKIFNVPDNNILTINGATLDSDTMVYALIDTIGYSIQFISADVTHRVIIEKQENNYKVQEVNDGHTTIIRYLHDGDQRIHKTISYSIGSFMADIVDESTQNKFIIDISGLNTNTDASIQYATDANTYPVILY